MVLGTAALGIGFGYLEPSPRSTSSLSLSSLLRIKIDPCDRKLPNLLLKNIYFTLQIYLNRLK